jgi:hypothetical protein
MFAIFCTDAAPMFLYKFLDDGQTKPGALVLGCHIRIKQPVNGFGVDAGTDIADANLNIIPLTN